MIPCSLLALFLALSPSPAEIKVELSTYLALENSAHALAKGGRAEEFREVVAMMSALGYSKDNTKALSGACEKELTAAEKAGLRTVREAFADRGYDTFGQLLPRDAPGALVTDLAAVAERAVRMAVKGEVATDDGSVVLVSTESICVHGDTPGAVEIARTVRTALENAGVELSPFAP